jgi:hypothetical protein
MLDIRELVTEFTENLSGFIETQVVDRARNSVAAALGAATGKRGPGRPGKLAFRLGGRRKPPIQYCPVPGCKNPAAPVFGMVCAKHKDVAKTKIKKYRAARKAAKLKTKRR